MRGAMMLKPSSDVRHIAHRISLPARPRPDRARAFSAIASAVVCAAVLATLHPAVLAQSQRNRWVGTWATAEVGRPQAPAAPVTGGPPPFMANACPAGAPPSPVFMHFNNQTLRQIVHTSIGGSSVRVVLSNQFGTAPLTIGAAAV